MISTLPGSLFHTFWRAAAQSKWWISGAKHSPPFLHSDGPVGQTPRFQHFTLHLECFAWILPQFWLLFMCCRFRRVRSTLELFINSLNLVSHRQKYSKHFENVEILGILKMRIFMISDDFQASWAWFSIISARSCAKQMMDKWCAALSCISLVRRPRRAKT